MINYGKQNITNEDINSVVKTLKSQFLTQGPIVKKFEQDLKKTFKSNSKILYHFYDNRVCYLPDTLCMDARKDSNWICNIFRFISNLLCL